MKHGKKSGYNAGCRCESCTKAQAEYQLRYNRLRRERLAHDPSLAPHGSIATYSNWGCRCDACRQAWSAYLRVYRHGSAS